MLIVGITGSVAAGKSAVADLWRDAGVPVASADRLARRAVRPGTRALARLRDMFGSEVIRRDGTLDRAVLRRIIVRDEEARRRLEAVVHPAVRRLRDEWTAQRLREGADMVAWEVPLLFETGMEKEVDAVVVVDAPASVRRTRMMEARGMTAAEADALMGLQWPAGRKRRRADAVVENRGTREELAARASEVLDGLRERARLSGRAQGCRGEAGRGRTL